MLETSDNFQSSPHIVSKKRIVFGQLDDLSIVSAQILPTVNVISSYEI